jgi:molecular chaperone GrpE
MNPEKPESTHENEEVVSADATELKEAEAIVEDAFGKLKEELTLIHDRYLRLGAEFENYKKRSERERLTSIKFANESLLSELLPVLDHLEQAIVAAGTHSAESVVSGVQMVLKQFKDVVAKSGLKEIESLGTTFNPNLHEALAERESNDHDAGVVLEEFQKGYMLNDRLVRPARVVVSKKPRS